MITIIVSRDVLPRDEDVEAAVRGVWARKGRKDFALTVDDNGKWSEKEFNLFFGEHYEVESGTYHPGGRIGAIAQLIAAQTGGDIEREEDDEDGDDIEY